MIILFSTIDIVFCKSPKQFKAIVEVKRIKEVERDDEDGEKKISILFSNEFSLSPEKLPDNFYATCWAITSGSTPYDSGKRKYFKPKMGQRALAIFSGKENKIIKYKKLSPDQERKIIKEYQIGTLFMNQVLLQKNNFKTGRESNVTFKLYEKKKKTGQLKIFLTHNKVSSQKSIWTEKEKKITIKTDYKEKPDFELTGHVIKEDNTTVINQKFYTTKSRRIPEGKSWGSTKFGLPANTITDLLLLEYVRWLPFKKDVTLKFHLIDSRTGNLSRDLVLSYNGKDSNDFHSFKLCDRKGNEKNWYKVTEQRTLYKVIFPDDRKYISAIEIPKEVKL